MLVLTRRRMEKLYIGGDICVTVVRLEGGQVRLGIDAPRHVRVVRAELRERDRAAEALDPLLGDPDVDADVDGPAAPARSSAPSPWPDRSAPLAGRAAVADQGCETSSASRNR